MELVSAIFCLKVLASVSVAKKWYQCITNAWLCINKILWFGFNKSSGPAHFIEGSNCSNDRVLSC